MWDLHTINELNKRAQDRARELGLVPTKIMSEAELLVMPPFPFPNIGADEVEADKRWERIDTLMVDTSGYGREDEPALTIEQFIERLRELVRANRLTGIRCAIIEEGQFQLYVGVWKA